MPDTPKQDMIEVSQLYRDRYNTEPETMIKVFRNVDVPVKVMMSIYDYITSDNESAKIENLDNGYKSSTWNKILEVCPGISKERAIEVFKCIYVIHILNEIKK